MLLAFPEEQARVRACLVHSKEIGVCAFYCANIKELLQRADKAATQQDLPAMISIFKEMREIQEPDTQGDCGV